MADIITIFPGHAFVTPVCRHKLINTVIYSLSESMANITYRVAVHTDDFNTDSGCYSAKAFKNGCKVPLAVRNVEILK